MTIGSLPSAPDRRHPLHMKKRILAAFLWFYVGWYMGAMLADLVGLSPAFGPILGTAMAAVIVGDPRRLIWPARPAPRPKYDTAHRPV